MKRLLLYKTGRTPEALLADIGDYESWFARVVDGQASLEVHHAIEAPRHPLRGYDGIVITGSPQSLTQPTEWMQDAATLVRDSHALGLPLLGVCFGHQLIGYAFGCLVRENPRGWEIGTTTVTLNDAGKRDALYRDLPQVLTVNQSHQDEVFSPNAQVRQLASNQHSSMQSLAVGEHLRGVQFHPEMSAHVVRHVISYRRQILVDDAKKRARAFCVDATLRNVTDTPLAERVLQNFVRFFVGIRARPKRRVPSVIAKAG